MTDKIWIAFALPDPEEGPILESFEPEEGPPPKGYLREMFGSGYLYEFRLDETGSAVDPELIRVELPPERAKRS